MSNEEHVERTADIVPAEEVLPVQTTVDGFSRSLRHYLQENGLPSENILVAVDERWNVISNVPRVLERFSQDQRARAYYISKFIAACGAGLFDAGLNFLWDEVINNLRAKVAQFDLEYFYDTAIKDPQERRKFSTEDDLRDLDDWALVKGCSDCGIITDIGYRHLDYIREMRNWASAAHPNQAELSGFQLLGWLDTCIREVLARPVEGPVVEVRRLLRNVREQTLVADDVPPIVNSIQNLPDDLNAALLRSVFGMYTDPQIDVRIRTNLNFLAKAIWDGASEEMKFEVGLKYSNFSANGDIPRRQLANQFLGVVEGRGYLPESELALHIQEKVEILVRTHQSWDNFYNEVPVARELRTLIPVNGLIPAQINTAYVRAVVLCRVGRHSGVSRGARQYYDELIARFQGPQVTVFLDLLNDQTISNRVQFANCAANFRTVAATLAAREQNLVIKRALEMISTATDELLRNLGRDARFQRLRAQLG
jgi:hypothetical protein